MTQPFNSYLPACLCACGCVCVSVCAYKHTKILGQLHNNISENSAICSAGKLKATWISISKIVQIKYGRGTLRSTKQPFKKKIRCMYFNVSMWVNLNNMRLGKKCIYLLYKIRAQKYSICKNTYKWKISIKHI